MFVFIGVVICWILAAICNAIMDTLVFRYDSSIFRNLNPLFWDASKSWRNKYKGGIQSNGPKYLGSTTFLVFTTDAWHFFQFLSNSFIIIVMLLLYSMIKPFTEWWIYVLIFFIMKFIWGFTFENFFSNLFRRKIK